LIARREFKCPTKIHESAWNQNLVALAAKVSRSTVKRAYATFESLGWIIRGEQIYDVQNKRFEGTPVSLSQDLVDMLRLDRSFDSAAKDLAYRPPVVCSSVENDDSVKNLPAVVHSEPLPRDSKQSLKRQSSASAQRPKGVPSELSCLVEKGLSKWTVFWLMRLATESQKRLSDLVQVFKSAIEKRQGQDLVGFLRKKITDNVDYTARQKTMQAVAQNQAQIHKAERVLDGLVGQEVEINGIDAVVHIERTQNGFYGRVEGRSAGIPHGRLIELVKARKVTRYQGAPKVEAQSQSVAEVVRPGKSEAGQSAMLLMKSIVGIKRG
jgi:hypothetical protein